MTRKDFQPAPYRNLANFSPLDRCVRAQDRSERGSECQIQTKKCFSDFELPHGGAFSSAAAQVWFQSAADSSDEPAVNNACDTFDRKSSLGLSKRQRSMSSFKTFDDEDSPFVMQLAFSKHRSAFDSGSLPLHFPQSTGKDSIVCRRENDGARSRVLCNGKSTDTVLLANKNTIDEASRARFGDDEIGQKRTPHSPLRCQMFAEQVRMRGNSCTRTQAAQHWDAFVTDDENNTINSSLLGTQPRKVAEEDPHQFQPARSNEVDRFSKLSAQHMERLRSAENVVAAKQQTSRSNSIWCQRNNDSCHQNIVLAAPRECPDSGQPRSVKSIKSVPVEGLPFQLITRNGAIAENEQNGNSGQWLAFVNGCLNETGAGGIQILLHCRWIFHGCNYCA